MPKQTPILVRPTHHQNYCFVVAIPPELNGGKRERKFFVQRKHAQEFAADLKVRKENFGTRLLQMPAGLRQEALDCAERLKPFQASLTEAVTFFIQHRYHAQKSCTFSELLEKLLVTKKSTNRSARYLNDLRRIGGEFAQQHGARAVSEISPDGVENWAANDKHGPTTRNNRLRTLSSAFSLAVTRRWCESNPVFRVERSNEAKPVAGYLSAAQAKALLDKADADLRPCIAIQLFAGLRPCEMAELTFEQIDLEQNQIWVDKEEHTTSHRVIDMMPNLRAWLLPYAARFGRVQPAKYQARWDELRPQVGLYDHWPHDGLRHSFGTWHYAKFQDLGKTAAQMGHSQPMITRKHYVVRVDPRRADEYWNLAPAVAAPTPES